MGLLSKLFGRSRETDDERELRSYKEQVYDHSTAPQPTFTANGESVFEISDTLTISGRGTVVTGTVTSGSFSVGDRVSVNGFDTAITAIEQFRKQCDTVCEGDNAGIFLRGVDRGIVSSGDLIIKK